MTRKDYELIAAAIKATKPPSHHQAADQQHEWTASTLADALGRDNPRFDRERFIKACGC